MTGFVIAGAVGDFFLFALLGLLALPVTAWLDKSIGKEKALLLWAGVIAGIVFLGAPDKPSAKGAKPGRLDGMAAEAALPSGDPFAHPGFDHGYERNIFQKHSDTRPLPPVELPAPPWIDLAFPMPPTVPGPAPGHQRALRGSLPAMSAGDGSAIAAMPEPTFTTYERVAEDVYDWHVSGVNRTFVFIRGIKLPDAGWVRYGEPGFQSALFRLTGAEPPAETEVEFATIGTLAMASKALDDVTVTKNRRRGVGDPRPINSSERWHWHRSVDNLYRQALRRNGIVGTDLAKVDNWNGLVEAAKVMAEVGATGKEDGEGWARAVDLLERAYVVAQEQNVMVGPRARILAALLEAHRARRNEGAVLRTLSEWARTAPENHRPWNWLGDLMLDLGLPDMAVAYQDQAVDRNRTAAEVHLGRGDALTHQGKLDAARAEYEDAGATDAGLVALGTAWLRIGRLDDARRTFERALSRDASNLEAQLGRGATLYALGQFPTARAAFEQVATSSTPEANRLRAMATYNLGLACVRQGQHDAAVAAFRACEAALQMGAQMGNGPTETVSPGIGLALAALASGRMSEVGGFLTQARSEAPGNPYAEFLAAVIANRQGNLGSSTRALERSQSLAEGYAELDGWLAWNYLRLAEQQAATDAESAATAETFARALAYAERASARELAADSKAFRMPLRLALVQLRSQHLARRERLERALKTVQDVVGNPANRDNPIGHTLLGWIHYTMGGDENVRESLRDFDKVLDDVPEGDNPWSMWRAVAADCQARVKHWRVLRIKSLEFLGTQLPRGWETKEGGGVRVNIDEGMLEFRGEVQDDGEQFKPTVQLVHGGLATRDTFEQLDMLVRIPMQKGGRASNNITWGIQVVTGRSRGIRQRTQGIGIFYDKGHMAFRVGGGRLKSFEDGLVRREANEEEQALVPSRSWPEGEWQHVRIKRVDAERGRMVVYMAPPGVMPEASAQLTPRQDDDDAEPAEEVVDPLAAYKVFEDQVSGFKLSSGPMTVWLGAWGNAGQPVDVRVKDVRIVRREK